MILTTQMMNEKTFGTHSAQMQDGIGGGGEGGVYQIVDSSGKTYSTEVSPFLKRL